MSKKVSQSQIIGDDGVSILSLACSDIGLMFRELGKDFGIDGQIELLKSYDGLSDTLERKFELQLKTIDKLKSGNKAKTIKKEDLEYWCSEINIPVFIFVVEKYSKRTFWVDPRPYFEKIKKTKKKTITLKIDIGNELIPANKKRFEKFLKNLNLWNAKKELKRESPREKIRITAHEKGYEVKEVKNELLIKPTEDSKGSPFSIKLSAPEDISNQVGEFSVKDIKISIGDDEVLKISTATLHLAINKEVNFYINNKKIQALMYYDGKKVVIESVVGDPIILKMEIFLDNKPVNCKLNFSINLSRIQTIKELVDSENFLLSLQDFLKISIEMQGGGERVNIVEKEDKNLINVSSLYNKNFLSLVKNLLKIENQYNIRFNAQKVLNSSNEQLAFSGFIVLALLKNEASMDNITLSGQLLPNKNIETNELKKQFIRLSYEELPLFDERITKKMAIFGKGEISLKNKIFFWSISDPKVVTG